MIPQTSREIIEEILLEKEYSIELIAKEVQVSKRSIQRIAKGEKPCYKVSMRLIRLYVRVKLGDSL